MHVGTQKVAHLHLLSVRVWEWGVGLGRYKWWKLHFLKCIHKSSYTLAVVSSYQIPGAASFPILPAWWCLPTISHPPIPFPSLSSCKHTRTFLIPLHFSDSCVFVYSALWCFPVSRFYYFCFTFFFLYSPHLSASCSFCSTRGRSGRSGVKKGLLCAGNRTWVHQPVARSLYRLRHIFILEINQLDAQNLSYNKFISCLYMFRAPCAHRQEVKIVLYSLWYHHTYILCIPIGMIIPEAV